MNQPSRFDLFQLGEGEPKLTVTEDTKIPDAATFTINKEDHTLANMLRAQLLLLPYVIFSGYKVPHPLEPVVVLKVQTDGTYTPIQAVQAACTALVITLAKMKQEFQTETLKAKGREEGGYGGGEFVMEDGMGGDGGQYYGASVLLRPQTTTTATTSTPPFLSYSIPSNFSLNPFSSNQSVPNPSSATTNAIAPSIPFVVLPIFSKHSYLNKKGSNLKANVVIKVDSGQDRVKFYVHKEILGLASPFFEVLLNGGWSETEKIKAKKELKEREKKLGQGIDSVSPGVDSITPGADEGVDIAQITLDPTTNMTTADSTEAESTNVVQEPKETEDTLSMTQSYMSSIIEQSITSSDDDDDEEEEEDEGIICRLKLKEEKASSFQDLLSYVYPRTEMLITWVNVGDLCKMANKFDLPNLKNSCSAFLLPSAAGNPIKGMQIAEENGLPELYKEASRYLLDAFPNWLTSELSVLSPSTLLKLERRRSWYLERVLKLSQIQISRDYVCHAACLDPSLCSRLVDEKWKSAWNSGFRFGTPQPSIIYRSLRSLEPSLSSPALHLPQTACQSHARLWIADLFDRMFLLGIVPSRSWGALTLNGTSSAGGLGRTFGPGLQDNVAKNGGAKYFLSVDMD